MGSARICGKIVRDLAMCPHGGECARRSWNNLPDRDVGGVGVSIRGLSAVAVALAFAAVHMLYAIEPMLSCWRCDASARCRPPIPPGH